MGPFSRLYLGRNRPVVLNCFICRKEICGGYFASWSFMEYSVQYKKVRTKKVVIIISQRLNSISPLKLPNKNLLQNLHFQLMSLPAFSLSIITWTACLLSSFGANCKALLANSRAFVYSPIPDNPLAIPISVVN